MMGIVSRKDVYVAVTHEKGALRVCAEVSHQRVDPQSTLFVGDSEDVYKRQSLSARPPA